MSVLSVWKKETDRTDKTDKSKNVRETLRLLRFHNGNDSFTK